MIRTIKLCVKHPVLSTGEVDNVLDALPYLRNKLTGAFLGGVVREYHHPPADRVPQLVGILRELC